MRNITFDQEKLSAIIVAYKNFFRVIGKMRCINGKQFSIFRNIGT